MTLNPKARVIEIDVTLDDIMRGKRADSSGCAIALAAKRVLTRVNVSGETIYGELTPEGSFKIYDLPDEAKQFISNFDVGNPVAPFKFVVIPRAQQLYGNFNSQA